MIRFPRQPIPAGKPGIDILLNYGIRMPRCSGKAAEKEPFMSLHSSLKAASKITAKRNVLKRFERIDLLRQRGKWKDGDRAYGLPKTKPSTT